MKIVLFTFLLVNFTFPIFGNLLEFNRAVLKGDTLIFNYTDDDLLYKSDTIFAFVYSFTKNRIIPDGQNAVLVRADTGLLFKGIFIVPDNALFGLVKIGSQYEIDNNNKQYWDYITINEDSIPSKYSMYRAALSYLGTFPEHYGRLPDFEKAKAYFIEESNSYQDNLLSQIAELSLNHELGYVTQSNFEDKLKAIIASSRIDYENEQEIALIIKSLRLISESKQAKTLESKYITNYPNSELARKLEFEELAEIDEFEHFIDRSLLFLREYPSSDYSEQIILAIIQSYLQIDRFEQLNELFKNTDLSSQILFQLASNIFDNENLFLSISDSLRLDWAENYILRALNVIETEIFENLGLTPIEVELQRQVSKIDFYFLLAHIYNERAALDELRQVISKIQEFDKEVFSETQLYEISFFAYEIKSYEISFYLSEQFLIHNINDIKMNELNRILYSEINNPANYLNYYDSIFTIYEYNRLKHINNNSLSKDISYPVIKSLDGISYSLKMLQGKILVIYSFAYFCDQCWDVFNDIEKLFKEYQDSNNVMIIPVLLWEKNKKIIEELVNFSEKNNLNCPIYYDFLDEVYKELSITGVPTISIIGQTGKLNFRIEGLSPQNSIFDEVKTNLEYLLGKK